MFSRMVADAVKIPTIPAEPETSKFPVTFKLPTVPGFETLNALNTTTSNLSFSSADHRAEWSDYHLLYSPDPQAT